MDCNCLRAAARLEKLWEKVIRGTETAPGTSQGLVSTVQCPPKQGGLDGTPSNSNIPIQAELNAYIQKQNKQIHMVLAKGRTDICPEKSLLGMFI